MASSEEIPLPKVLQGRLLVVADYQRPYAWGRKQLSDLWEDIDLMDSRNHYAGTLVLRGAVGKDGVPVAEMEDGGDTLQRWEVVDGQQRLTTCLLLIDRIRRRFEILAGQDIEKARLRASNLRTRYLMTSIRNARRPILSLGSELNTYLGGQRAWRQAVRGCPDRWAAATAGGEGILRHQAERTTG